MINSNIYIYISEIELLELKFHKLKSGLANRF
jgi:hypothetical protein